jgi:hypothetical protein
VSRNLLAKHKLEPFKEWLTSKEIEHRPSRGIYEVLRVRVGDGWQCVFDRHDAKEHYTVAGPLEPTVRRFIKEARAPRSKE